MSRTTLRAPDQQGFESLESVRVTIITLMCRITLWAGGVALALGAIDPIVDGIWWLVAIYATVFAAALAVLLPVGVAPRLKGIVLIVLLCAVAASELAVFAFNGAGYLLFFFAALLAVWFFSTAAAVAVVTVGVLTTIAVIAVYAAVPIDLTTPQRVVATHWTNWLAPFATFLLVSGSALVLSAIMLARVREWVRVARAALAEVRTALVSERELTRELHHRVRNNLQLVNSLIRLELADGRHESLDAFATAVCARLDLMSRAHEVAFDEERAGDARVPIAAAVLAAIEESCRFRRPAYGLEWSEKGSGRITAEVAVTLALTIFELCSALFEAVGESDARVVTGELSPEGDTVAVTMTIRGANRSSAAGELAVAHTLIDTLDARVEWISSPAAVRLRLPSHLVVVEEPAVAADATTGIQTAAS